MGKPKLSEENAKLEQELRDMILSNVRIGNNEAPAPTERGGAGYHRGRGNFQNSYQSHGVLNSAQSQSYSNAPNLASNSSNPTNVHQFQHRGSFRGGSDRNKAFQQNDSRANRSPNHVSLEGRGRGSHLSPGTSHFPHRQDGLQQQVHPRGKGFGQMKRGNQGRDQRNFGRPQPPPMETFVRQCAYLDHVARVEIPPVEMGPEEIAAKEQLRAQLELVCQEALRKVYPDFPSTIHLQCYGSLVSGLAIKGSDVDMTIRWSGPIPEDPRFLAELPRILEQGLLESGCGARLLSRTRIPIIKVCESPPEDLLKALLEERDKWEALPDGQKYPELALPSSTQETGVGADHEQPDTTSKGQDTPQTDPDVSREGRVMDSPTSRPRIDTLAHLEYLKSPKRADNDDLQSYCYKFIKSATVMLEKRVIDDHTACSYFLEGLSDAVRKEAIARCKLQTDSSSGSANRNFSHLCPIVLGIISDRDGTKPAEASKQTKVWTRERIPGPLDFPKSGVGIQCDINFSNPLGIHNTQLLRCYTRCDPRVRPMIFFVKAWAKRRKINSAYSGTLSSYGFVLMVLHFLANVAQPPVIPNLQHAFGAGTREVLLDGYNVSFWDDEDHIVRLASQGTLTQNTEPLGVLLRNLFNYYATQGHNVPAGGFNWMRDVLSMRTQGGLVSKESKGWTGAKTTTIEGREVRQRYLFCIEDPFEIDHNVARPVTHNGIVAIRDEFRRAWRILMSIGYDQKPDGELFDYLEEDVPVAPAEDISAVPSQLDTRMDGVPRSVAAAKPAADVLLPGLADLGLGR